MNDGVLIIGAGPTGLTLACELARAGVPFRLVEAADGPASDSRGKSGSRGKGVQPRSLEVFDDLGIARAMLAVGRIGMPTRVVAQNGDVSWGGDVPDHMRDRPDIPYPASLITPQWRVEQVLRERLESLGGSVEFGTELIDVEQHDDGVAAQVAVTGDDGATETQTVRARWLVGADGGHSIVRKRSGIPFVGETVEAARMQVADVAVEKGDGEPLERDAWHMWRHDEGFVSLCPLPSTELFQLQATVAPGQPDGIDRDTLQSVLRRRSGRDDLVLSEVAWSTLWRANIRIVERYRDRNVFLAGDAAHIHSPAGGQGMNTGIQDSHNLGWKLAAVARGASAALLDTYEEERRPVAAGVIALSNARMAEALSEQAIPVRRDSDSTQLSVTYRGGTLARDDRSDDASLRAGDRAPDATDLLVVARGDTERSGGKCRLFELTAGGRPSLLAFGAVPRIPAAVPPGLRVLRIVDRSPDGESSEPAAGALFEGADTLTVIDTAGHLASAYEAAAATVVLIRPDGYIALISDAGEAQALRDALASIA